MFPNVIFEVFKFMNPLRSKVNIFRFVKEWYEIGRLSRRITPFFSKDFFRVFRHGLRICSREGYSPETAFRLGLFDLNLPGEALFQFISKRDLVRVQSRVNPKPWGYLTEDKGIFYPFCRAMGLPTPRLYALFFRETMGWTFKGFMPSSLE